jgi:ABC-2 type transport system permease protein
VWRNSAMVAVIGLAFFTYSIALFRKSIAATK